MFSRAPVLMAYSSDELYFVYYVVSGYWRLVPRHCEASPSTGEGEGRGLNRYTIIKAVQK